VLWLHRELHDDFEHVEDELDVGVADAQNREQVGLQHAPRRERAVRRHHVRVVAAQVALQVRDAVLALLAHPVLVGVLAGGALLARARWHAHATHDEEQLLLIRRVELGGGPAGAG